MFLFIQYFPVERVQVPKAILRSAPSAAAMMESVWMYDSWLSQVMCWEGMNSALSQPAVRIRFWERRSVYKSMPETNN